MDKKLNNKGLTIIEVLVCFSIVSVIVIGMLKTVTNYKDKQDVESYKSDILTYKNMVTEEIMSDVIDGGGIKSIEESSNDNNFNFTLNQSNGNAGSSDKRTLTVYKTDDGKGSYIEYASVSGSGYDEKFEIPDVANLKFNEVRFEYDDDFVILFIDFTHPDLGNGYNALNSVIPRKLYP